MGGCVRGGGERESWTCPRNMNVRVKAIWIIRVGTCPRCRQSANGLYFQEQLEYLREWRAPVYGCKEALSFYIEQCSSMSREGSGWTGHGWSSVRGGRWQRSTHRSQTDRRLHGWQERHGLTECLICWEGRSRDDLHN